MRRTRLLMIAIASLIGTVLGEGLAKRAIALFMCGVFSFNSTACYASFGNRGEVAIAQIPRVRQQNQSPTEKLIPNTSNSRQPSKTQSQEVYAKENLASLINCDISKMLKNAGIPENSPEAAKIKELYQKLIGVTSELNKYRQEFLNQENPNFLGLFPTFYYNVTLEELERLSNGDFKYPREKMEQMIAFFDAYKINRQHWDNKNMSALEEHWKFHFEIATKVKKWWRNHSLEVKKVLESGIDAHVDHDLARAIRYTLDNKSNSKVSVNELKRDFDMTEQTLKDAGDKTLKEIFDIYTYPAKSLDWLLGTTKGVLKRRQDAWNSAVCKDKNGKYCELKPQYVDSKKIKSLNPNQPVSDHNILRELGERLCPTSSSNYKDTNLSEVVVANKRTGKQVKGTSYGDPHLITFDGHRYSFQTVGEFILAKSSDRVFEVQTRQSPVNRSLSLNSAVAMRVGNDRVAFYSKDFPDSDTSTPLRVNGKPTVVKDKSLTLHGGGSIQKQSDSNYVVQWATGEKVAVTIYSRGQFQYMDVFPFVFESQANQMVGLLGNVNGKENDDLRFRSGDILPSKSTYGDLSKLIKDKLLRS